MNSHSSGLSALTYIDMSLAVSIDCLPFLVDSWDGPSVQHFLSLAIAHNTNFVYLVNNVFEIISWL